VEPSGDRRQERGTAGAVRRRLGFHFRSERIGQGLPAWTAPHKAEMIRSSMRRPHAVRLTFVPHLIPMTPGILATATCIRSRGAASRRCRADARPVRVNPLPPPNDEVSPATKSVTGSNTAPSTHRQDGVAVVTGSRRTTWSRRRGPGGQAANIASAGRDHRLRCRRSGRDPDGTPRRNPRDGATRRRRAPRRRTNRWVSALRPPASPAAPPRPASGRRRHEPPDIAVVMSDRPCAGAGGLHQEPGQAAPV